VEPASSNEAPRQGIFGFIRSIRLYTGIAVDDPKRC
jgi:hypothetical protein